MNNFTSKKFIGLVAVIIVVGAIAYGGVWYWQKNISFQEPLMPKSDQDDSSKGEVAKSPVPNTKVQWKAEGVALSDLGLLKYQDDLNPQNVNNTEPVKYYDIGMNGTNKIVMAVAPAIDPTGPAVFFFEQNNNGYRFMSKMSNMGIYSSEAKYGYVLTSSKIIETDTNTFYYGITGPADFVYKNIKLEQGYFFVSDLFKNYVSDYEKGGGTIQKVDSLTDLGDLYLKQKTSFQTDQASSKFYLRKYVLKLPSGLYTEYNFKYNFFTDNMVPRITWSDGVVNEDNYSQDAGLGGCSNHGVYAVSARDVSNDLKISGVTNTKENIYELKDINDPIVKLFYSRGGRVYNETTNKYDNVPLEQWVSYHPVIFYKNPVGDYIIFVNDKYGSGAECGKPVVYLYPTQKTNVRVMVGADVAISEPEYNQGWSVEAYPDGSIKTNGGNYESLFWEGLGWGEYPSVTEGFVVPSSKISETLKSHLNQLGLTEKESSDFLEFWLSRMPKNEYVRLTWFTNDQLDILAPLVVLPKPETTIRVFLDFEGLDNPVSIKTQNLQAVPRKGFTVVEWGGILRK